MSDDLAARLVGAVANGIVRSRELAYPHGTHRAEDWTDDACAAAVVMLRALASEADRRGALSVSVTTLRTTADRIEKGDDK